MGTTSSEDSLLQGCVSRRMKAKEVDRGYVFGAKPKFMFHLI